MMWNLQSYPTTVLNERMWHFRGSKHTLTPPAIFRGSRLPNLPWSTLLHNTMPVVCLQLCYVFPRSNNSKLWGTGIRGLMRGMATLPKGNQELLVVRDKVGRLPGELGVSKSMKCDNFPFGASVLLVGRQEGHPVCKKTGCWFVGGDLTGALHDLYSSSVITTTSIILCFNKHRLTQVHLENGR